MMWFLHQWEQIWGPLRVFEYISVRTMGAAGTAFIICLIIGKPIIERLRRLKVGQHVRDDEVMDIHRAKEGTPTMGGIMMILAVLLSVFLWVQPGNMQVWLATATMVWMGMIGFLDDYLKVVKKNSKGLSARWKIILQSVWICVALAIILWHPATRDYAKNLMVPFYSHAVIQEMPMVLTFIFMYLVVVGSCNAVNLTDGMDGLAAGCMNSAALAFMVMAYAIGRIDFSEYLLVPYIPGAGELTVFCGALLGAGLGFLWYNCHPAQVFMGDTGSLALGGALAMVAILIKQELALVIIGGVFVMEALSVVLQVGSYRLRGGKRIFRCAPIHHHFEIVARETATAQGRDPNRVESMVTTRLWILSIVFAILGLVTLKIR
jgi:phospho-N-acetylmuramoyl-pentapeptide-transferase